MLAASLRHWPRSGTLSASLGFLPRDVELSNVTAIAGDPGDAVAAPSRLGGGRCGMTSGQDGGGRPEGSNDGIAAVRVFVSYAHDDAEHEDRVQKFWLFLREQGIDARLDLPAMEVRQDWAEWMTQQVRDADRVLVIASPAYKRRAEGDARPDEGRGLQWEARL